MNTKEILDQYERLKVDYDELLTNYVILSDKLDELIDNQVKIELHRGCAISISSSLIYIVDQSDCDGLVSYLVSGGFGDQLELIECVDEVDETKYSFIKYWTTSKLQQYLELEFLLD